jgi:glyoxylate/succinic semialdehyde reductase
MEEHMDIAFLGLGIMGSRMAANLSAAGHTVRVWNRSSDKAQALASAGCIPCATPVEAVEGVQLAITMLADPPALESVAHEGGLLAAMPQNCLWVDCSTVDPDTSRRLGAEATSRGLRFLDAPVSGSLGAAAAGKLIFLVGGDAQDLDQARPALEAMGVRIVHAGPVGAGSALKLVNNLFLAQTQAAWSESLGLATKLGLSIETVHDAVLPSHVAPGFLTFKRPKLEAREWSPEFPLRLALKDIRLALACAREAGLELAQANTCEQLYSKAFDRSLGDLDISAIHEVVSGL